MNTHKLFQKFNGVIRLTNSKREKLKISRSALRDKISKFFEEKRWIKPEFHPQGSFPLETNLNPIRVEEDGVIKEKYDMDDGVYFISPESDRKTPETYHYRIKKAVEGHASDVIDKNTCVRVVYADGHHFDLPAYWLEDEDSTPQLAHKSEGFIDSDPVEFMDWVKEKISETTFTGQLRRIIRYLKAWKDYRENKNSNLKLPAGFILAILACNHYKESDRDDLALCDTIKSIENELDWNFVCYRPTTPEGEELLGKYNAEKVLHELKVFVENAQKAIDSDCEEESSEYWRKVVGDRFPVGDKGKKSFKTNVERPWISF